MTDKDWEFQKKCEEAAKEVFEEAIENIKKNEVDNYIDDRLSEAADNAVPIYTNELYGLVEYLDEYWDECHKDSKSLDDALRYACYMKASEYVHSAFTELGGTDTLDNLQEVLDRFKTAMKDCDKVELAQLMTHHKQDLKDLGIDTELPEIAKPTLKP